MPRPARSNAPPAIRPGEPPTLLRLDPPGNEENRYKSADVMASNSGRFMSDDGRVAFSTAEALSPRDTDGKVDVYEFVAGRPQLIGGRDRRPGRTAEAAGCSVPGQVVGFESISRDGSDIYFSTFDTLVPQDQNGPFVKFYDARVGGGFPVAGQLLPCEAADECHGETSRTPVESERSAQERHSRRPGTSRAAPRARAEQAREASQAQAPQAPPEPAQPQACTPSRGARMSEERKRMRARAMRQALSLCDGSRRRRRARSRSARLGLGRQSRNPAFELERSTAQAGGHPNIFLRSSVSPPRSRNDTDSSETVEKRGQRMLLHRSEDVHDPFPDGLHRQPSRRSRSARWRSSVSTGARRTPRSGSRARCSASSRSTTWSRGPGSRACSLPRSRSSGRLCSRFCGLGRTRTTASMRPRPTSSICSGWRTSGSGIWGVPTDPANDKYRARYRPPVPERLLRKQYPEPCFETPVRSDRSAGAVPAEPDLVRRTDHGERRCHLLQPRFRAADELGPDDRLRPARVQPVADRQADDRKRRLALGPGHRSRGSRRQQSPTVPSASELKSLKLALPEGLSVNPNAADGKSVLQRHAESAIGTLEDAICPQSSKIGTLSIDSSALPAPDQRRDVPRRTEAGRTSTD